MMHRFKLIIVTGLAGLAFTSAAIPAHAKPKPPAVERHSGSPTAAILQSASIRPGAQLLFLSGQLPNPLPESAGKPPAELTMADYGDTKTQTVATLAKIKGLLAAQGYTMGDVFKMTVFVAGDPKLGGKMDFAGMNEGFRQFFLTPENPVTVTRSTVQVAALAGPNFLVEIEVAAAK
ncbi:RidA family protein [Novosphingobium sp.]|uniref:RidA family protein n=1 Tax=Novosphingobium sp. TaxID=1874826 RepID=UPI0025E21B3C|nr:RidA family protein [Novosphingobium sp.]